MMRYGKKDYVLIVGQQYVKRDFFGELFLSNNPELMYSFETEEDAYIAKNNSRNADIRNFARVYERNTLITYEACDQ
ncbi:MAG: hypothetical protein RR212_00225 [Bacteroidales bacterium]|jgi:hypothetical protein